jgi:hypothetical protein
MDRRLYLLVRDKKLEFRKRFLPGILLHRHLEKTGDSMAASRNTMGFVVERFAGGLVWLI